MKALTIPEIAQALWEVSSVLILTHRRPDGGTAGSAAALFTSTDGGQLGFDFRWV